MINGTIRYDYTTTTLLIEVVAGDSKNYQAAKRLSG